MVLEEIESKSQNIIAELGMFKYSSTAEAPLASQLSSVKISDSTVAIGVPKKLKKHVSMTSKPPRFTDYQEPGYYIGELSADGKERQGRGKMIYDSGASFIGNFVSNKYHGAGTYRWSDGDEQEGIWKEGLRHGPSIFRSANTGEVEYSIYENGNTVGEGVFWSSDRKTALKLIDGKKNGPMPLDEAHKFVNDIFGFPLPPMLDLPDAPRLSKRATQSPGILRRLFPQNGQIGADGKPMFKDYGEWGSYQGLRDAHGRRQGQGKIKYDYGNIYEGPFLNDKYHGDKGIYKWADGDEYEGEWKDGERNGFGIFRQTDGSTIYSMYANGKPSGKGVEWNADRKHAFELMDGEKQMEILPEDAESFAKKNFNLSVPEPYYACTSIEAKKSGLLGRFFKTKDFDSDGKPMFKDNGEWGTYEGDPLDDDGDRQGTGRMTYVSGNSYQGPFVSNKYHGDKGIYRWADGEQYEGRWSGGERDGFGIFTRSDGSVFYSMYERGKAKGEGVQWNADRSIAHKTEDGNEAVELLTDEAEKLAMEKFNLPAPVPAAPTATADGVTSIASQRKIAPSKLMHFFSSKVVTEDGQKWFKDNGEWGTYEGDPLDSNGDRQGNGKMTYSSGSKYEGGFINNKYHCEKGIYRWFDGDFFEGPWKNGERDGAVCIYRKADGGVEYSAYVAGQATGEGLFWEPDRATVFKLKDGERKGRVSLSLATKLMKEKFNASVPDIGNAAALKDENAVESAGKIRFTDFNDTGYYSGSLDKDGKRQGEGKMVYDSGATYEGYFADNKFEGPDKSIYKHGTYKWKDGDFYMGQWKKGKMHGVGLYQVNKSGVDYSLYEDGAPVGVGIHWNADNTKAFRTLDGVEMDEITLTEAADLALSRFRLTPPKLKSELVKPTSKIMGLFRSKAVTADGKRWFKDNREWGTYVGDPLDSNGDRQGNGKMTYSSGSTYEGGFVNNKYHCEKGIFRWFDGDFFEGPWKNGERDGAVCIYTKADGGVEYSAYVAGQATGEGLFWEPDRKTVYKLLDGVKKSGLSLAAAEKLAMENFKLPAPSPFQPSTIATATATSTATTSFSKPQPTSRIMGLFRSKAVTADGKLWFKDHGEWGTYEGDPLDSNGDRQGNGKMTYSSGNTYEGGFVNNKYHCEKGIYRWFDGDFFEGPWVEGDREGDICIYRKADGTVEYSAYVAGQATGEGIQWPPDRLTAFKLVNGVQKGGMSFSAAEKFSMEKFKLPVPKE